ncbi:MAG: T9SS type A sorting domain-containing protein [Sphingobacteriales bacterium]|nr:MAG: T9SS type A sorting domain-containing protein [Sphingobacteriales bacterium]
MKKTLILILIFLVPKQISAQMISQLSFVPAQQDSVKLEVKTGFGMTNCPDMYRHTFQLNNDTLFLKVYYDPRYVSGGFFCTSVDTLYLGNWSMPFSVISAVSYILESDTDTVVRPPYKYIHRSVGIKNIAIKELDIQVYPNPVSNTLFIDTKRSLRSITIQDVYGKVVLYESSPGNSIGLDMLPKGLYLLKMETEGGVRTEKIIKE